MPLSIAAYSVAFHRCRGQVSVANFRDHSAVGRFRNFAEDLRSTPGHQVHNWPPSATIMCPLINDASSEARNAATEAISSGRALRPSGILERSCSSVSPSSLIATSDFLGIGAARGKPIHTNSMRSEIVGETLHQRDQSALGGRISRDIGFRHETIDRSNHNHRTGLIWNHYARGFASAVKDTRQIDLDNSLPLFVSCI